MPSRSMETFMRKRLTLSPALLLCTMALLFIAGSAFAKMDCDNCDPYGSHCSDPCYICRQPGPDPGTCRSTPISTTCGDDRVLGGNCLQNGCSPSFYEVSRVNQGTYQNNYVAYCNHHKVEWVTEQDANHCNLNSFWWTRSHCEDHQDGYKFGTSTVDCCDGYGPDGLPDSTFTCNHFHSCTG